VGHQQRRLRACADGTPEHHLRFGRLTRRKVPGISRYDELVNGMLGVVIIGVFIVVIVIVVFIYLIMLNYNAANGLFHRRR
jgi:hypothetical protein